MKRTITLSIMLAMVVSVTAQDYDRASLISFEQFEEQVIGLNISGFSGRPQFDDEEEGIFQAYFLDGDDVFMIKIEARHSPPVWMGSPYEFDGNIAEFMIISNMGMLIIDLPETYSVLALASTRIKDKAFLERIARETGLMKISPALAEWPSSIPAEYRMAGALLNAVDASGSDTDGFSREVRVTLIMSNELKLSLREMAQRYGDEGNFLPFPNGIILNYPFSDIDDMEDMFSDNDEVRFVYYIP